jgi:hypothetical protein
MSGGTIRTTTGPPGQPGHCADRGKDSIQPAACPSCGAEQLAQIDETYAYARVVGIYPDGAIEWEGWTDYDPHGQVPVHDPPRFVCQACHCVCQVVGGQFMAREGETWP